MQDSQMTEKAKANHRQSRGGQDLQYLRTNNLWVLLSAIWNYGPTSRFDLAHLTGLAPSSVTRMIRMLCDLGLIIETGKGESSGGRQPTLIVPNPAAGLVISLDLSGTRLRGGIFDAANNLIKMVDQPFTGLGPEKIQKQILEMIHTLLAEPAARSHTVLGIGISLPGEIRNDTGELGESYNLRLHNFPLRKILTTEFNLPVYLEHDASVAALAEYYYGAGRGLEHMIYILVSTGIGSGVIADGQIYRGETGRSGEFGHIIVDPDGNLCVCGKRGCLEAVAAAPAILASARWMVTRGGAGKLSDLCNNDPDQLTIEKIALAAQMGDPIAQDILSRSTDYLAQGITVYASLFDIRRMIIGGEVAEVGEVYFNLLHRSLEKYKRSGLEIEIIPAELKQNTFLRGISMITLQDVLRSQLHQLR